MIRQEWLQPAADGPACGANLEYDQDYLALEEAARGRPEAQYGTFVTKEQEPDWTDVVKRATALLDRSRDLRIVQLLTRGLTRTKGLSGLRDGLELTRGLLENFWESLHPQLDFDGEPDPVLRANAVATFADTDGLVSDVRQAIFLRAPLGNFTVRDVEKVLVPPAGGTAGPVTPEQLRAVVRDAITADAHALAEAEEGIEIIDRIRTIILAHFEPSVAPDLAPLRSTLKIVGSLVGPIRAELAGRPDGASPDAAPASTPGGGATVPAVVGVGEIRSRDDALRALERVCDFLMRNEPTNPAPLLIRRAQRVMTMPFLDIIRELAPEAAGQVENITGGSKG